MAYTSLNFVPGEILTAAKMNLLAANDASLRDGTGILDDSIQLSKISRSIITIKGTAEYTTNNNSIVNLNAIAASEGSGLSHSSQAILIGAGVSKILVSANLFIKTTTPASYAWGTLKKNNTSIGCHAIANATGNFATLSFSPYLLDVSPGDRISLEFFDAPGGGAVLIRGAHSWLTAQVVA